MKKRITSFMFKLLVMMGVMMVIGGCSAGTITLESNPGLSGEFNYYSADNLVFLNGTYSPFLNGSGIYHPDQIKRHTDNTGTADFNIPEDDYGKDIAFVTTYEIPPMGTLMHLLYIQNYTGSTISFRVPYVAGTFIIGDVVYQHGIYKISLPVSFYGSDRPFGLYLSRTSL